MRVYEYAGGVLRTEADALDAIGSLLGTGVDVVAVPVDLLAPEFFDLRTGLAGAVMQKFVQYRLRLAVVGDLSPHTGHSKALRDLVYESNRGNHIWFVPDRSALDARLTA
jgi:hypothetical protein